MSVEQNYNNRDNVAGSQIVISNLVKSYGTLNAVDDVSLTVRPGEFLALLGPSGSGKSTILMSIAGFESPTSGELLIDGVNCTHVPANKRNVGMVFQHYTLFPHMSVLENVAFPLKMRGVDKGERYREAELALERVHLGGYGGRKPSQLSGGQQQRVALARAIVYKPQLLLMDEPFSALDKKLREEMRLETKRLHADLGITIVFVTHDQEEALTMADRVAVLKHGRIQQIGPARELYERPANLFAAGFIGNMNFIPVELRENKAFLPDGTAWPITERTMIGAVDAPPATLAVRPERMGLTGEAGDFSISGRVQDVIYSGADVVVIVTLTDGTEIQARLGSNDGLALAAGDEITLYAGADCPLIYGEAAE